MYARQSGLPAPWLVDTGQVASIHFVSPSFLLIEFMIIIFLILFLVSFALALRSMKDFDVPQEIRGVLRNRKVRGTILFLKNKVVHHSSASSSP